MQILNPKRHEENRGDTADRVGLASLTYLPILITGIAIPITATNGLHGKAEASGYQFASLPLKLYFFFAILPVAIILAMLMASAVYFVITGRKLFAIS